MVGPRHLVADHRVPVAERAATAVLAGEPDRRPGLEQGRESQRLGAAPVDVALAAHHLLAPAQLTHQVGMRDVSLGDLVEAVDRRDQALEIDAGLRGDLRHVVARVVVADVDDVPPRRLGPRRGPEARQGLGQLPLVLHADLLGLLAVDRPAPHEEARVVLAHRGVVADARVEHGLRVGRFVTFVVTPAAVTDDVDDGVAPELALVVHGQPDGAQHGLGEVAVGVRDGRLDALRHVGAVVRRAHVDRARRETDLVVHDQVHRAAAAVGAQLRHVERLGGDPLSTERGVAVDEDRQNAPALHVPDRVLVRTHHAADDRVDRLEMARVGRKHDLDLLARGRRVGPALTEVVLDVAGALLGPRQEHGLELAEDLGRRLAHDVRQDVEPPAVGHADDHALDTALRRTLDQLGEGRNQRVGPLEREALVAHVAGVQETLEVLGARQQCEDPQAMVRVERHLLVRVLGALSDPPLAVAVDDVHVLQRPAPAVRATQGREDLA